MALTTNEEIRRVFELATLRREARTIRTPREWHEVNTLMMRCSYARHKEEQLYKSRYQARVEQRRLALIDEAGAVSRDLTPVWGTADRFSPAATLRQARRDVQDVHQRRMDRIDGFERRQMKEIIDEVRRQNRHRGLARDDFNHAADDPDRPRPRTRDR